MAFSDFMSFGSVVTTSVLWCKVLDIDFLMTRLKHQRSVLFLLVGELYIWVNTVNSIIEFLDMLLLPFGMIVIDIG